ncbi:MAG: c-type cytochrome [Pirellulaceae bacterium]
MKYPFPNIRSRCMHSRWNARLAQTRVLLVVSLLIIVSVLWLIAKYSVRDTLEADDTNQGESQIAVDRNEQASSNSQLQAGGSQGKPSDAPFTELTELTGLEKLTDEVERVLAQADVPQARQLIAKWQGRQDGAQIAYLRGLCEMAERKLQAAESEFKKSLATDPAHRKSLTNLGLLLEQQERTAEALPYYQTLYSLDSQNEPAAINLARILRKLGRSKETESFLPPPQSKSVSRDLCLELAEREYAQGNYSEAVAWFEAADLNASHLAETLRTAASAYALSGDVVKSQALFNRVDKAQADYRHIGELQRRLQIDPSDAKAENDLRQMANPPLGPPLNAQQSSVSDLYLSKCASCHGSDGLGDGLAARFLYPRPRNLQAEPLRIASTRNAIASDQDIAQVIRRGLPGTSMPAFPDLKDDEVAMLVETINRFRQPLMREQPAEALPIPEFPEVSEAMVARGKAIFETSGCSICHQSQGRPGELFDSSGRLTLARDLAHDYMKGGDDSPSLYARIRLGMPGTPHPALDVPSEKLVDLVAYCQSLSQLPKRDRTNHQRFDEATAP